jgi:hypothetical protein
LVYRFQQQHGRILVFRDGGLNVLRRRGILVTLLAFFANCSTSLLVNSVIGSLPQNFDTTASNGRRLTVVADRKLRALHDRIGLTFKSDRRRRVHFVADLAPSAW